MRYIFSMRFVQWYLVRGYLVRGEAVEVVKKKFGVLLRQLRIAKGLSERQLASRVGVSVSYISKIENGAFIEFSG